MTSVPEQSHSFLCFAAVAFDGLHQVKLEDRKLPHCTLQPWTPRQNEQQVRYYNTRSILFMFCVRHGYTHLLLKESDSLYYFEQRAVITGILFYSPSLYISL